MPRQPKTGKLLRLYHDLANWFHLLTAPSSYKEPAAFYSRVLEETSRIPLKNILELGSGGGNNASHMKKRYKLTLSDISEDMLAISRKLNPECKHIQGDMREVRLGRQFDAVFIHDAISYLTMEKQLTEAIQTSYVHCKPGGSVLFCPDYIEETLVENTEHGGHSKGNRGLRYLSWTWDPDVKDTEYYFEMVYLMKDGDDFNVFTERHCMGVFKKETWFKLMTEAGFKNVKVVPYPSKLRERAKNTPVFAGIKPKS